MPDFNQLAKQYISEFPALTPVAATRLGDHRFDGELDEVDEAAWIARAKFQQGWLSRFDEVDPKQLSRDEQVDLIMLRRRLESLQWHIETLREWSWNPLVYTQLAGSAIYNLMSREFAPVSQRLIDVGRRLEQFPRFFQQAREVLIPELVPEVHACTAATQNLGSETLIDHLIRPQLDSLSGPDRTRLNRAIETATAAIETHQRWLETDLLAKAEGDYHLGAELYEQKLTHQLQTPIDRHEIRQRAQSDLQRVRDEMYELAQGIYKVKHPLTSFPFDPPGEYKQAIIRAALEEAYADLPARDAIVETAGQSLHLATEHVKRHSLVELPDDPLEIIVMPEFQRGVALAYCDSPGPMDAGLRTFYAVAPPPADWTEDQVRSHLREYNIRSIHNLTIHEAIPGHYLQLAHARRHPSLLRAILASGVFIEGWAVYSEEMMVETGLLGGDPLMRLIVLKWALRDFTNALLDQAVHVDRIEQEEGLNLLIEDAFQEEREANAKWRRAQLTSAQMSEYYVGLIEVTGLRREAEERWGNDFELRRFHDELLSHGSPTPSLLRSLMFDLEI